MMEEWFARAGSKIGLNSSEEMSMFEPVSLDYDEDDDYDDINPTDSVSNIASDDGQRCTAIIEKLFMFRQVKPAERTTKSDSELKKRTSLPPLVERKDPIAAIPNPKSIFVSYSPDAKFLEKKLIYETVKRMNADGATGTIWFDVDEQNTDSPCWLARRLEAAERCRCAILFLSESYFSNAFSHGEGRVLLDMRKMKTKKTLRTQLFAVLCGSLRQANVPEPFWIFLSKAINLATGEHAKMNLDEQTSFVSATLTAKLTKILTPVPAATPCRLPGVTELELAGTYLRKKICHWTVFDVQNWLADINIHAPYRKSAVDQSINGFLLSSITDQDLSASLCIRGQVARKKILHQRKLTLEKELLWASNWALTLRVQRPRPNSVYIIFDEADARLAWKLRQDLEERNLQVDFGQPDILF